MSAISVNRSPSAPLVGPSMTMTILPPARWRTSVPGSAASRSASAPASSGFAATTALETCTASGARQPAPVISSRRWSVLPAMAQPGAPGGPKTSCSIQTRKP